MFRLLIIADDFTGALDTGVQFSKAGIRTMVTSDSDIDFSSISEDIQVLSVDTETRHLSAGEAYDVVECLSKKAKNMGVEYIYKKVDSCLRGNIGSELEAIMKVTGEQVIALIPAFPKTGRTTVDGIQYFKGMAIHESGFARDPINPIWESRVSQIISAQSQIESTNITRKQYSTLPEIMEKKCGILICDAETDEDLRCISQGIFQNGRTRVVAGSGGFAEMMPEAISLKANNLTKPCIESAAKTLFISGSIHAVSMSQIHRAKNMGMPVFVLSPVDSSGNHADISEENLTLRDNIIEKLDKEGEMAIVSASDSSQIIDVAGLADKMGLKASEIVLRLTDGIGRLASSVVRKANPCNIVVFGGDTLFQIMRQIGCAALLPQEEIVPGVVVSVLKANDDRSYLIVSKSGSFGDEHVVDEIMEYLHSHEKAKKVGNECGIR